MNIRRKSIELGGRDLTLETGIMAKLSAGSVTVRYGDTIVLVTVNASTEPREGIDFFPLTVEYREKSYAGGKIPGGFFKREGRPSEKEILAARLTDRPIRPLFPDGFRCETQVIINVLSTDQENPADILASIGASTALMLSDIPWDGPIACVRIGFIDGRPVLNPTYSQLESSKLDLILTGNKESIVMMEGEADEISEDEFLICIEYGLEVIKEIIDLQYDFLRGLSIKKRVFDKEEIDNSLIKEIEKRCIDEVHNINMISDKKDRRSSLDNIIEQTVNDLAESYPEQEDNIKNVIHEIVRDDMRNGILTEKKRMDGRDMEEIRPIDIKLGILPRAHGSALFSRGETQSLSTVTLGSKRDEQFIDDVDRDYKKQYMLHYNFPPFSVGEARPMRGVSRREVGHGILAEKAFRSVLPSHKDFPYTIRVVSDILESNGSSSMATVCAGSLALMDGGVTIKKSVAGISIGLVTNEEKYVLLTDILGIEDHFGDMDFKVAGTKDGITTIQLDLKIKGISKDIIADALQRAKEGRLHILKLMDEKIEMAKESISEFAPKIIRVSVPIDKIGEIIGPGGRTIRSIIAETGAEVEVDDESGSVLVSSVSLESCNKAKEMIKGIIIEPEVGMVFKGIVKRITDFGAFVEITPGKEGLVHISELEHKHVKKVEDVIKVGNTVEVKVIKVDNFGRIDLSRKALIERPQYSSKDRDSKPREKYHGYHKKPYNRNKPRTRNKPKRFDK